MMWGGVWASFLFDCMLWKNEFRLIVIKHTLEGEEEASYTTANDIIWYQKEENQNLMRVCMWVKCKGLARILLHGQTQKSTLVDCAVETSNKGIIMWNKMRLIRIGVKCKSHIGCYIQNEVFTWQSSLY